MGDYNLVVPKATVNLLTNPSAEKRSGASFLTTGWSTGGTNTLSSTQSYARRGVAGVAVQFSNDNTQVEFSVTVPAAGTYTFSIDCYLPDDWDGGFLYLDFVNFVGSTEVTATTALAQTGSWKRISITETIDAGDLTGLLRVRTLGTPTAGKFAYYDGAQLEESDYPTTYCDGDQDGCSWDGGPHESTSRRSALSDAGGVILNLADDLSVVFRELQGGGVGLPSLGVQDNLIRDGAEVLGMRVSATPLTMICTLDNPADLATFHSVRKALTRALASRLGPKGKPPLKRWLYYSGHLEQRMTPVVYDGGLEAVRVKGFNEELALKLLRTDPAWLADGTLSQLVETAASQTYRAVFAFKDGAGAMLGPPNASGTYTSISRVRFNRALRELWVGGSFANFDNVALADNFATYSLDDETWSTRAQSAGPDSDVHAFLELPTEGDMYLGGAFDMLDGISCKGLAKYDHSAGTIAPVGAPSSGGTVLDMAINESGVVYIVGSFTNWDGIANADYIASFNSASPTFAAVGTGANATIRAIAIARDGTIYVGGDFTSIGGTSVNRLAKWDGSAWSSISGSATGANGAVHALHIAPDGTLYIGGAFTSIDGESMSYAAKWDGVAFRPLRSDIEPDNTVYDIVDYQSGILLSGDFQNITSASVNIVAQGVVHWNGSAYIPPPLLYTSTARVASIAVEDDDIYLGHGATGVTGTVIASATATVSYAGTERAHLIVRIINNTSVVQTLRYLANVTTGARILFDYDLIVDEELTIDLRPGHREMRSNLRGSGWWGVLDGSELAALFLAPGALGSRDNVVSVGVLATSGVGDVLCWLQWQDAYMGYD